MTAATITPPALSRARRLAELDRLAVDSVTAFHLSATSESILVAAYACPSLPLEDALSRWLDVIAEYRRYLGVVSSDPRWGETELDVAIASRDAAMADLLDGTATYRRRHRAISRNKMTAEEIQAAHEYAVEDMGADQ